MSTARILPLEAPYAPTVAEQFARFLPPGMEPLNLFRTQAHNPRVLQRIFAGNLLDQGSISQRERELIILRTCARCGSEYEWGVHVALFSQRAALSAGDVAQTLREAGGLQELAKQEAVLLRVVDSLHDTSNIADGLWDELASCYSHEQIIEIIALVGSYHTISFMTNAARVKLEPFAARFPVI